MAKITTVRGDIKPETLGFTSMHDHTLYDLSAMHSKLKAGLPPMPSEKLTVELQNLQFLQDFGVFYIDEMYNNSKCYDFVKRELELFKGCGGSTIVDCSAADMRADVQDLRRLSEETGVNIVTPTGLYIALQRHGKFLDMDENELFSCFMDEIENGIDGTDIKPGFIKCALGSSTPEGDYDLLERDSFRAAARAAKESGLSLHLHTQNGVGWDLILKSAETAIKELGVSPDKIVMCHMDVVTYFLSVADYVKNVNTTKALNYELPQRLLDLGVNIGLDSFGCAAHPTGAILQDDYDKLKELVYFIDRGYENQIVLGHDNLINIGGLYHGGRGYTHLSGFVVPQLKALGYSDETVNKLVVDNPARILAY